MRIDKPLSIVIPALIVSAIIIALLLPWQYASAQTAAKEDTLAFFVTYTPRQAQALQAHLGPDWRQVIKQRYWREAWRNLVNEAKDRYRFESAIIFDEGWEQYMTEAEQRQRDRIRDSTLTRKARYEEERRIADSIAAAKQTQGSVFLRDDDQPQLAGLGIGKMLSPRMEVIDGWIGGGGGIPTSSRHGGEAEFLQVLAGIAVVGVVVVVLIIYGIVTLVS